MIIYEGILSNYIGVYDYRGDILYYEVRGPKQSETASKMGNEKNVLIPTLT